MEKSLPKKINQIGDSLNEVLTSIFKFYYSKIVAVTFLIISIGASFDAQASAHSVTSISVSGTQSAALIYQNAGFTQYTITLGESGNGNPASSTIFSLNWVGGSAPAGVGFSPTSVNLSGDGQTVTLTLSTTSSTPAGVYSFSVTSSSGNKTSNPNSSFIVQKPVTESGATASNKVYDGTNIAAISGGTLSGVDAADAGNVSVSSTGTFAQTGVGNGISVTLSLSGSAAAKYSLTQPQPGVTANITVRTLTVTATGNIKIYDGTTTAVVTLADNRVSGDVLTDAYTTATFADKNVGTNKTVSVSGISISGTNAGNYSLTSTTATATANITAKSLTYSITVSNKVYNGTSSATITSSSLTGVVSGDNVSIGSATFTNKDVGPNKVVTPILAGTDAGNYILSPATVTTTASITAAPITITANNVSKTYGQTVTFAGTAFTSAGLVNGETVGSVTSSSTGAVNTANVGTFPIAPSAATGGTFTASNYAITYTNGTLTVNAAPLTITATDQTKTYGTTLALGTTAFTSSGLVNNQTIGSVTLSSTGAMNTANIGTYQIVASGANGGTFTASNYSISYTNGTLTVSPKGLTITANSISKTYGQAFTFAGTEFTSVGLTNSDAVSSVTLASTGTPATAAKGTYTITASSATGTGLSNYTITYTNGTLTVNAAPLTITANSASKTYGQTATFAGTAFTSSGLVNGETVGSVTSSSTGAASAANVGTYPIVPSAATGGTFTASNYAITYTNGTLTVNAAPLTITATDQTKTYGTTLALGTTAFTSSGLVNNQTIGSVTLSSTGAMNTANIGTYQIVASGANGGTFTASNYSISYTNGTLTVSPKGLTITANSISKTYGQAFTFAGTEFTSVGLTNSDAVSSVTLASTGTPATAAKGTYTITASSATGTGLSNYTITYTNGTLTVNAAPLTITANNQSKCSGVAFTFNGTEFSSTGLVNSETIGSASLTSTGAPSNAALGSYNIIVSSAIGGTFNANNYTINYVNGTMTVSPNATITLSSTTGTDNQTKCISTAITNITYTIGGGGTEASITTGSLPAGVTGAYNSVTKVFTISGTPTVSGTFNYTVTTTGTCVQTNATGTITVNPNSTISLTSANSNQTVCINSAIAGITYSIGGGGTGATLSGLPSSFTGSYSGGTFTISGTPTGSGIYNFTVTTTGACAQTTANGTITVNAYPTITLSSATGTDNQTDCNNTTITNITYNVTPSSATVSVNGLPPGVTGNFSSASSQFIIRGTATSAGTYPYTLIASNGICSTSVSGTIIIKQTATITRTSASGTDAQQACNNSAITPITYMVSDPSTNPTVTGLPTGVNAVTNNSVLTISGTPAQTGTFNYTITFACAPNATGTITVNPNATIALTSAAGTDAQTPCINTTITNISYSVGGGGTSAGVTGLPSGVNGSFSGGVFTISGTPTVSGTFNYIVTTTGTCTQASASGTITVTPTVGTPTAITIAGGTEPTCQLMGGDTKTGYSTTATNSTGFNWSLYQYGGSGASISTTGLVSFPDQYSGKLDIQVTANGCNGASAMVIRTVIINKPFTPVITVTPSSTICNGQSATLTASGDNTITYSWSTGATTQAITVAPTTTTTYSVTANSSGCTAQTASQQITVSQLPSIAFASAASDVCFSSSVQTTPLTYSNATNAPTTYSITWSTAATNAGFQSVTDTALTASPVNIAVPANAAAATYTGTITVKNANGCAGSSAVTFTVTVNANSWIGKTSTDWNVGTNWSCGRMPFATENAIIPSGVSNMPVLTSATAITNLIIQNGAKITLQGQTFTINGDVNKSGETGVLSSDAASSLVLGGTGNLGTISFDQSTDSITNAIKNFTVNTTGTFSIGNKLYLLNTLALNSGTINSGGNLTLRSTSIENTANVAPLGAGASINGDVTVERFFTRRRAYRFVSPSVTTTTDLRTNWMEGENNPDTHTNKNPHPGYGTHITGYGGHLNYFDETVTNNPSVFTYGNNSQVWTSLPNSNGTLTAGSPIRIIVRGSRAVDLNNNTSDSSNTILRTKGTLFTGSLTLNTSSGPVALSGTANGYSFIGNPYASPVDWDKIFGSSHGITATYYTYDPYINTRGGYVAWNGIDNSTNNTSSEVNRNIQSGQGFFIRNSPDANPNPSLQFQELYKTNEANTKIFRTANLLTKLSIQLLLNADSGKQNTADGVLAVFDSSFTNNIGDEDSYKFTNQDENLAINHRDTLLSIDGGPAVTTNDTIHLKMWQFRQKSYLLRLTGANFSPEVTAYVKDAYLKNETQVDLSSPSLVPFSITSDSTSFAPDRFMIVFKSGRALPVTLTHIKAYTKDKGIQVDWTAETEININKYEVEKSADGQHFVSATTIKVKANNGVTQNYGWFDDSVLQGNNYYRIKVTELSGAIKYSEIVVVNISGGKSSITVYPNPVKGNTIAVHMNQMKKGRYTLNLYNALGQKMYTGVIDHYGGSAMYQVVTQRIKSKGAYMLHVTEGTSEMTETVLFE